MVDLEDRGKEIEIMDEKRKDRYVQKVDRLCSVKSTHNRKKSYRHVPILSHLCTVYMDFIGDCCEP